MKEKSNRKSRGRQRKLAGKNESRVQELYFPVRDEELLVVFEDTVIKVKRFEKAQCQSISSENQQISCLSMRIYELIIILFTGSGKWKRHFAMISLCSHKLPSGKYFLNIVSRNPQIKYLKIISSSNVDNVLIHMLSKNVLMQLYNTALCPCVSTLYLLLSLLSLCFLSCFLLPLSCNYSPLSLFYSPFIILYDLRFLSSPRWYIFQLLSISFISVLTCCQPLTLFFILLCSFSLALLSLISFLYSPFSFPYCPSPYITHLLLDFILSFSLSYLFLYFLIFALQVHSVTILFRHVSIFFSLLCSPLPYL